MSSPRISHQESGYCEVPARLDCVAETSALLKAFCQRKCLDESLWPQIDLAFCECMNNAIEHGCKEDEAKTVRVTWKWIDEFLEIEVEDPGSFVPPTQAAALPENPLSESGRGYFIIDSIAESYEHQETEYGHKICLKIRTHLAHEVLEQMEDMYAVSQQLTHELGVVAAERDILSGFTQDMATCPIIERIIEKGIERLRGIVRIEQVDVWRRIGDDTLENTYHEGPEPLAIKEAIIAPDKACACLTAIATESEQFVEDCSILPYTDPLSTEESCALVCPIIYQRDCIGVIAIHSNPEEQELLFTRLVTPLKVFAQFLGLAYTSDRTFRERQDQEKSKTQLQIASEIQRSLLPSSYPNNSFCRITGRCEAAMAVGGDYFDAIEIRDVGILIVIADVMGKGVPAALLATIFRTAIRSRLNLAETPGWLLAKINKQFHDELGHLNMFITAQAAFYSYEKKMLKLANAGHCPALLLHPDRAEVDSLTTEGLPLGVLADDIYEERLVQLQKDSRVLFLTDGIYEAENPAGEMLGMDRLVKAVPSFWREGLNSVTEKAFQYVARFTSGRSATDDQTLMALEIL